MKIKNKRVLVYGLGLSGKETIKFLLDKKAKVFFYDDNEKVFENFKGEGVTKFVFSLHYSKIDLVVISPGVYNSHIIKLFEIARVKILNEIELASMFIKKSKIIAITGTNGKTTTTHLVQQILENAGKRAIACGNLGVPLISVVSKDAVDMFFIVEISSFQLERTENFKPNISAIINISPDHLNRHKSYEEYIGLKFGISKKQGKDDFCILNSNLELHKNLFSNIKAEKLLFGNVGNQAYTTENEIFIMGKSFCTFEEIKANKNEIMENYLVAIIIAAVNDIDKNIIIDTIKNFKKEAHRIELVGIIEGVKYINDSKATNPASTLYALKTVNIEHTILLLGGADKNFEFNEIFEEGKKIKHIVCFGQAGGKIYKCGKQNEFYKISKYSTLRQGAINAMKMASRGDTVLLSPACASFDEFSSYKERGDVFKRLVYGKGEKENI